MDELEQRIAAHELALIEVHAPCSSLGQKGEIDPRGDPRGPVIETEVSIGLG